jgi:predicted nuclease of predicted toxin-antitoxin system
MKFVADECVEAYLIDLLRVFGHTVYSIREENFGIDDPSVLQLTNKFKGHILITCDRDFGELIFKKDKISVSGVIYLRLHSLNKNQKISLLGDLLQKESIVYQNYFTTVSKDNIRFRFLNVSINVSNCYVLIPAFNESTSIGKVIRDIPKHLATEIIVINNGSTDDTAMVAEVEGATVLTEHRKGYGYACLKGIEYLKATATENDIVVFLDGDYSDFPEEISILIDPIHRSSADLVIGSRVLGNREPGSMLFQQIAGNWLATKLIKLFFNAHFTDLGPFRAITFNALQQINMQDKTFGWTVEMQVKAAKLKLKFTEIPVSYRKRIGVSKVSGTINGTIMAGYKILLTIFKNI